MKLKTYFKQKTKQTIVFIHGNSSSAKVFDPILNSDIKYSTLSFDLLGHGDSPRSNNIKDYSILNQNRLSIELINSIEGDKILVGNSLGGHIALEIADEIKKLKGLVIFGTPPVKKPLNLEEAFSPNDASPVFFTENPELQQIENAFKIANKNPKIHDLLVKDFLKSDPKVRVEIVNDASSYIIFKNEYNIFKDLNIPKLILQGEFEPLVNLEYISKLAEESNCDLKIVEDCGHYISIEKPIEFERIIKEFSEKCFNAE